MSKKFVEVPYSETLARDVFEGKVEGRTGTRIVTDAEGHQHLHKYVEVLKEVESC